MLNTADEKVKERLTKVTESYQAVQKRYTELGGKGGAEYKSLSLIDPKEKCAIIDPKTQTLFYFEK
ncbi:hypothetical protein KA478_03980 [Patescibacteria group bacterium]|nr:hypothetical protein [Patescibacteria group bacterium]